MNIYKLVYNWLCRSPVKWLIILDNADDAAFLVNSQPMDNDHSSGLSDQPSRALRDFVPQSQNGSVLLTTRSRQSALALSEPNDLITVVPMEGLHAVQLLNNKLGSAVVRSNEDSADLVALLEYMPLAIVQAAAYISELAPRYSVRRYVTEFRQGDERRSTLLDYDGGHLRRDGEAKSSIIVTWQKSFEHIRQKRPSAAALLSLMSFFDSQGIPEELLHRRSQLNEGKDDSAKRKDLKPESYEGAADDDAGLVADEEFETDVWTLRSFCFISLSADPSIFEMHKLVQLATRKWLIANNSFEEYQSCFISKLYHETTDGEFENWSKWLKLLPHAQAAVAQQPEDQEAMIRWAWIVNGLADYTQRRGKLSDAAECCRLSLRAAEERIGADEKVTLYSMALASRIYNKIGRLEDAEKLGLQALEGRKKMVGQDHTDTLSSTNHLAFTYLLQGRFKEAEEMFSAVVETKTRLFGKDSLATIRSMGDLANTYQEQGHSEEAVKLQSQVLRDLQGMLGSDHPETMVSAHNLSLLYYK